MAPHVIIFGPTGGVGSWAARTAQEKGAKVFLAMRDTQKKIPGLSQEDEERGNYERVQADLMDPASVEEAVKKTSAKRAFLYMVHGARDGLRATIQALKSAGIELVVFLSSFTVQGDLQSITPADFIAWAHAQVEINLQESFGSSGYVAIRPGYFATNSARFAKSIQSGTVKVPYAEVKFDWITPRDMGAVIATVLISPHKESVVSLVGAEQLSQKDAVTAIGKAIGKELQVVDVEGEEGKKVFVEKHGLPEMLAAFFVTNLRQNRENGSEIFTSPHYNEAKGNIEKYLGRPPMRFQEWVSQNSELFGA